MDLIKLGIIFFIIIIVLRAKKPLYQSMIFGMIATILLYGLNMTTTVKAMTKGVTSPSTITLLIAFYAITFLQRMLEKRGQLLLAEQSLSNIFKSRRVNAMVAPFIIGILPSAGAVLIAAPIVDKAGGDDISQEEKTFITSYYRHIPELFLPTYGSILLAISLSGVDMRLFIVGMLPMVFVLFFLGYFIYVRKIPKETGLVNSNNKMADIKNLLFGIWPIIVTILIILVFKMSVYLAVFLVILLSLFINKYRFAEFRPFFKSAIEAKLMISILFVMMFKELLTVTGVIERLPAYFEMLPIPPAMVFASVFFFGTIVAGSQAMIALALPLAYATIPHGGLGLLILLMSMAYIAMQISPTHICLAIVTEGFGTSMISLIKKTIPILFLFIIISSLYSYIL
jgi:uncharacterized protein